MKKIQNKTASRWMGNIVKKDKITIDCIIFKTKFNMSVDMVWLNE